MKKIIALLVSSTLIAASVAYADDAQTTSTSSDQVMQQMPGNATSDTASASNPAATGNEKPVAKHHVKHKKHKKHHPRHKAAAPAQPAATTDAGATQ